MSYYYRNRAKARIKTTEPSLTDQSQARETDINIIVGRMLQTKTPGPGAYGEPMSGDFTNLPEDLRGFIDASRQMRSLRNQLPAELKDMPVEQLLALTPNELASKLTPPKPEEPNAPTPEPKP